MTRYRIDDLARSLSSRPSRRHLIVSVFVLSAARCLQVASAKKKHRRKKRKTRKDNPNAFGCVSVGGSCTNGDHCCSGVCQGKKGRKTCQAHDVGGCQADQDACVVDGEMPCPENPEADCFRTTGNASFCGDSPLRWRGARGGEASGGGCVVCAKDADCEAQFGPGAACIACLAPGCPGPIQTACIPIPV